MDDEGFEMRDQGDLDFTNDDDYAETSFGGNDAINIDSDQTISKGTLGDNLQESLKQQVLKIAVDAYYYKLNDKFGITPEI